MDQLDQTGIAFLQHGSTPSFSTPDSTLVPPGSPFEDASADGFPLQDPLYRLLARLGSQEDPTPAEVIRLYREYFRDLGYFVPPTPSPDAINESAILSTVHPLGDVNGDGIDDFLFDKYCADWDLCMGTGPDLSWLYCVDGWPPQKHWLEARSGSDGEVLWDFRLDQPSLVPFPAACVVELVIGVFPTEHGHNDVLVYRLEAISSLRHHTVYQVLGKPSGKEGEKGWAWESVGAKKNIGYGYGVVVAHNVLALPHLQVPPNKGVPFLPESVRPSLWIRSIGYVYSLVGDPLVGVGPVIVDYKPLEFATIVDLKTGEEVKMVPTFQPEPDRSVMPTSYMPLVNHRYNSAGDGCCWDLNGDGVSEISFTTIEWNPIWKADLPRPIGPDFWASRIVMFDGKTGDKLYELMTEKGSKADGHGSFLQALGDVNGDGTSDYLEHRFYGNFSSDGRTIKDLKIYSIVHKGQDGSELWRLEGSELPDLLFIGDASGDHGNDFLIAYYNLGKNFWDGFTNVTEVRLVLHNGADGRVLWEKTTISSPIDLFYLFRNTRLNGIWDLDGDNVGELWVDDANQTDDLTVIHRHTWLSGRTGDPMFNVATVGAFSFPVGAGDLDGDGGNDFTITQGDLLDQWITAYNGRTGAPLWSRRVLEIPIPTAQSAVPLLMYYTSELDGNQTEKDLFLSFTMYVSSIAGGRNSGTMHYQQHMAEHGTSGHAIWSLPELEEGDASLIPWDVTPATRQYLGLDAPSGLSGAGRGLDLQVPVTAAVSSAACLTLGVLFVRRRWFR